MQIWNVVIDLSTIENLMKENFRKFWFVGILFIPIIDFNIQKNIDGFNYIISDKYLDFHFVQEA